MVIDVERRTGRKPVPTWRPVGPVGPVGPAGPVGPGPVSPARGPPTEWGELVQMHDDREAVQVSPDELPVIDIHSL